MNILRLISTCYKIFTNISVVFDEKSADKLISSSVDSLVESAMKTSLSFLFIPTF